MKTLLNKDSFIKLTLFIVITIFITMGSASAWNSGHDKTHEEIISEIYQDMPSSISKNLDLDTMKYGANLPDTIDKHQKWRHSYPASVGYAEKYLKLARSEYQKAVKTSNPQLRLKYYKMESKYLGMASHYISDTFAAPHSSHMNYYKEFYKYGDEIRNLKLVDVPSFKLKSHSGLKQFMRYGAKEGFKVAQYWDNHRLWKYPPTARNVVTENLNLAYSATLQVFKQWLGF